MLDNGRANLEYMQAYMFAYSMRAKTHAHHRMEDNVEQSVKIRRLTEMTNLFHATASAKNALRCGLSQLLTFLIAYSHFAFLHSVGTLETVLVEKNR